jgi:hypothetical protein
VNISGQFVVLLRVQSPSSSFPRGNSLQSWQNPGLAAVLAKCQKRPAPFSIPGGSPADASPPPSLPRSTEIPGVIAAGQTWKVVWSWEGNNADGPIAGDNGALLFANNDASNVMKLDPATGLRPSFTAIRAPAARSREARTVRCSSLRGD